MNPSAAAASARAAAVRRLIDVHPVEFDRFLVEELARLGYRRTVPDHQKFVRIGEDR